MSKKHTTYSRARIIMISIAVMFLVLFIGGAIGLSMLNPRWVANIAESKMTEMVGQEVTIDSIDFDLGTVIRLRVENAAVANPSWASNPYLASVDVLDVGIDVSELLGGDLVITDVQMVDPVIQLEKSSQGQANWIFKKEPTSSGNNQESASQGVDDDGAMNLPRIESLSVDDGLLTYIDVNQDASLKLSFESSSQKPLTDKVRMVANGGGQLMGKPLKISLSAGQTPMPTENDTNAYPVELQLSSAETTLRIEGTVDAPISPETVNLQLTLNGKNLSRWNEAFDTQLPALPMYQVAGHVGLKDGVWSIDELKSTVADSDLTGTLRVIPDADPLRVEGDLASDRLDIAQLQEFMPEQQDSEPMSQQVVNHLAFLANASLQTQFKYRADLINIQEVAIKDAEVVMSLENNALTVDALSGTIDERLIKIDGLISASPDLTDGRMQVQLQTIHVSDTVKVPKTDRASSPTAFSAIPGDLVVGVTLNVATDRVPANEHQGANAEKTQGPVDRIQLDSVSVEEFHVTYTDTPSSTKLLARLKEDKSKEAIVIEADGKYKETPLEFYLTIPELTSLMKLRADESFQRLSFDLNLANAMASVTAFIKPSWPLNEMDLRFQVSSDAPASIAALFGIELPTLGKLAMRGLLRKQNNQWNLNKFVSHVGKSNLNAVAMIDGGDELRMKATLTSSMLDVAALIPTAGTTNKSTQSKSSNGPSVKTDSSERMSNESSSPHWLTNLNGQVSVDVQRLVLPGVTLKDVSAKATVDEGLLRVAPLSIVLGGGTINTRVNLNFKNSALVGNLRTEIQRVDLGQAQSAFGKEPSALGVVGGRIALTLPDSTQSPRNTSTADALFGRLQIEEVSLKYDDPDLQAKSDLRLTANSFESAISIEGKVEYQGIPVDVSLTSGSIRQAIQDYRSLPVDATLQIKKTTVDIESLVGRLFPFESLTTSLRLAGPDLFRLGESINIPLPHLPPYDLHANLERKQLKDGKQIFMFKNLDGTIGDSDVAGKLRVTTGGERPMIFTRLHSSKLDLDDLAGLTGAPPDPEETASSKQKAQAEKFEDRERLLPEKPIDFTQLQKVDADVDYRAKNVQAPDLPLDDFVLVMTLQNGHMQMNRLDFGVAKGTAAMELEVNARQVPVEAKLKADFDEVNLSMLLASSEMAEDSFGNIGGKGTLWMRGTSLANWFASVDGGLYLTMTGGKMDALLVELAGLDFMESATVFLGTDTGVPIDCAYTDLQARSGIVTIQPFLFDTSDTKFKGHGEIDLRQEKMDLTVNPYPKDFTLLSSRGPLRVAGTFKNPSFSVEPSFPSPEFGTADDSARCKGMIEALRKARKSNMEERIREFGTTE